MANPMTTNDQVQAAALKPCPLCGSKFLIGQEPQDNAPVNGMFYLFHDYGPIGSSARECPIDVPKHFNTEAEAIAAWNTRATELRPIAWMMPEHVLAYQQGRKDGVAWVNHSRNDAYTIPVYATPADPALDLETVEVLAQTMEQSMFAPHELPLDAELHEKYLATSRECLSALRALASGEERK